MGAFALLLALQFEIFSREFNPWVLKIGQEHLFGVHDSPIAALILITTSLLSFLVFERLILPELHLTKRSDSLEVLKRILKEEELTIVRVLINIPTRRCHQNRLAKETGMSKVKTFRVVQRLSDRDIVKIIKEGNRKIVELAPWVEGS